MNVHQKKRSSSKATTGLVRHLPSETFIADDRACFKLKPLYSIKNGDKWCSELFGLAVESFGLQSCYVELPTIHGVRNVIPQGTRKVTPPCKEISES